MQVCTWCAAGIHRNPVETSPRSRTPLAPFTGSRRYGENIIETFLTATVVGLTAQFVTFIYELTTQGDDNLFFKVLISSVAGLLTGLIAFALLRLYDHMQHSRCVRCGLHVGN